MRESGFFCEVSAEAISPGRVLEAVLCPDHGGMNFFFGSVRRRNAGKEVVAVSYDAFEPLALRVLGQIVEEARGLWGASLRFAVLHRTGRLAPGEISVGVGVSSPHRDESYQASRYVIEQLKHRAPIWKKEHYANGETEWLKGHALCQSTGAHAHQHSGHRKEEGVCAGKG